MEIAYDFRVDARYLRFVEGTHEVTTLRLSEDVAIDCAPRCEIVGIEILSAREHLQFDGEAPLIRLGNLVVQQSA